MPPRRAQRQQGAPSFERIEKLLGHRFADRRLLEQALTHASAAGPGRPSNERLEFLGDRVLGLAVARLLFEQFPGDREGDLGKRLAHLVDRRTLAGVARELDLAPALRLSHGEAGSGGRANPTILADAVEALIGALFLDAGYEAAERAVHRLWSTRVRAHERPPRDPKTTLQEWAQGRGLPLPEYHVLETSGPPHAPLFRVEVSIPGVPAATGEGSSKREAEQRAAEAMLQTLRNLSS